MGAAIAITWARFGVKIEKENETQDMFELYISVPERSFHRSSLAVSIDEVDDT